MPSYRFRRPSVTTDCVVFGIQPPIELSVLLVKRKHDPDAGLWALPGGFLKVSDTGKQGEDLEEGALRELKEETGVAPSHIEQLQTFGKPKRDPRGRVISVAYLSLVRATEHLPRASSDASSALWFHLSQVPKVLAFDHNQILDVALARLRAKVRYAPIGFGLLRAEFTLAQLRELYETVLGRELDVSNFAKQAKATGVLRETGNVLRGDHRPARLYEFDKKAYEKLTKQGFNFEL